MSICSIIGKIQPVAAYLGWSGAEFFVEYGNPDHSNDFVNDGDFVTNGDWAPRSPQEVFKAFVRIYY